MSSQISYPIGSIGARNYYKGVGPSGFRVAGPESVLSVISHETGHGAGIGHGEGMIRREYESIMRSRK